MKGENDFNGQLSKEFRQLKGLHHVKVADKFTIGISDFLIWIEGTSIALETKFVKEWPKGHLKLLQHEFTGPQQTFLESIALTGNRAFGLVYVDCVRQSFIIPWNQIPKEGNWHTEEFKQYGYNSVFWGDTTGLIHKLRFENGKESA
jgi:hypothetical protein